ncbi:unnamed protein product [Sphagnum balticum]
MLWRAEREIRTQRLASSPVFLQSLRLRRRRALSEGNCIVDNFRRSSSNGNARTGWSYAIFWKLNRHSRILLTWEDGYYDFPKAGAGSGSELHFTNNGSREWSH